MMMRMAIFFVLAMLASNALSNITLVLNDDADNYKSAAKEIEKKLIAIGYEESEIARIYVNKAEDKDWSAATLLISVGSQPYPAIIQNSKSVPVIYSFVERSFSEKIEKDDSKNNLYSVVINQPVTRMLELATNLVKNDHKKDIIIFRSADTKNNYKLTELKKIYADVTFVTVDPERRLADDIEAKLYNAAAVVAPHDSKLWNGKNARWLLHLAYTYRVPVVAYAKSFNRAGAMVSIYASLSDVASSTALLAAAIQAGKPDLNRVNYPAYHIDVNESISYALGFDGEALKKVKLVEGLEE